MNSTYFFLPFVIVASLGIYQDSFAETGSNYFDVTNPDGSHTWSTHYPYILQNGNYVPFIYSNGNQIETNHGSVILNADGSYSFYKNGIINETPLFTDSIVAKYADMSNLNSFTYPNGVNNDTPDNSWNGNSFTSSKTNAGVGTLNYKYVIDNGKWKTHLEATNLSGLTTKAFGFDQIIDLNRDTIKFGGVTRNLDSFNNTTFDKAFLVANQGKVIDLLNDFNFDFDLGFDNLYSVTVIDTGANKSRLIFDYRTSTPLLPSQTLIIDPSYSSTSYTTAGRVISTNSIAATCSNTFSSSDATLVINKGDSAANTNCQAMFINFDVSSILTHVNYIFNASVQYEIVLNTNSQNIDWKHLNFTAAGDEATYDALTQDLGDVVDIGTNATAMTVGAGKFDVFTSNSTSRFVNDINNDNIITVGMFYTDYGRIAATTVQNQFTGFPTLYFTYFDSFVDAVTNLSNSTNPGINTIGLNWTAPTVYQAQTIIGYQINITNPQTNSPLVYLNDTGTTTPNYNVTGLGFGLDYSARVTAWTNNTGHPINNATGNVFNFTMATNIYNTLAPTNFLMLPNGTSTSILNLNWTAPLMDNINGYRIQCEAPVGGGFSNTVTNTTTAGTSYNRTGLSVNTYYNCKVAAMNSSGITDYSNTYSQTTFHLSDAVDDLVATPTSISDIILSFTQPDTLYGYLTGYNINYTTPQSNDPLTVYVASTGSSDVAYTLTGLTAQEPYSFRVSAITIHGKNVTGALVANATSSDNFTVGHLTIPSGSDSSPVPISFEVVPLNDTASDLVVTYDSSYDLACDFSYMIGNSNTTYSGLTETAISGSRVYSNFTVEGVNNDIIDVYCFDQLNNDTDANQRLGHATDAVPLFDQINSFQTGVFGTEGKFGALDLVVLIIVIVSMIGFNRDHPEVGVAIMGTFIGFFAFYGVIQWETGLTGFVVLVIALAIANSKRGSSN